MELELPKQIDPGGSKVEMRLPGSRNLDTREKIPQQSWQSEIVQEASIGEESCRLSILEQPSSSDYESPNDPPNCDDLPSTNDKTSVDQPDSDDETLVSTRQDQHRLEHFNNKPDVPFDEVITTLQESKLKELNFEFKDEKEVEGGFSETHREHRLHLIDAVGRCQSLKKLMVWRRLNIEEVGVLCQNLLVHPALEELWLIGSRIGDKGAAIVCEMLQKNHLLKRCALWEAEVTATGATSIGSMLGSNSTLEALNLNDNPLGPDGTEALLGPLTGQDGHAPLNNSLQSLSIRDVPMGQGGAKAVSRMLRTNNTMKALNLSFNRDLTASDVCVILESLEKNQTLSTLDLSFCGGVGGDEVLAKMMDLVRVNPWLTEIDLYRTPLEEQGYGGQVRTQLERNAKEYMAVVRDLPRAPPKFVSVFVWPRIFRENYFSQINGEIFRKRCQGKAFQSID